MKWTTDGIADGSEPYGDLVTNVETIAERAFAYRDGITSIYAPNAKIIKGGAFEYCGNLSEVSLPAAEEINGYAFRQAKKLNEIWLPNVVKVTASVFYGSFIAVVKFGKIVETINSDAFNGSSMTKDIYVPWSEGEVANAPWGATNATIHYNTVYDEDGNPITE